MQLVGLQTRDLGLREARVRHQAEPRLGLRRAVAPVQVSAVAKRSARPMKDASTRRDPGNGVVVVCQACGVPFTRFGPRFVLVL
jgi:hypothetical protein